MERTRTLFPDPYHCRRNIVELVPRSRAHPPEISRLQGPPNGTYRLSHGRLSLRVEKTLQTRAGESKARLSGLLYVAGFANSFSISFRKNENESSEICGRLLWCDGWDEEIGLGPPRKYSRIMYDQRLYSGTP